MIYIGSDHRGFEVKKKILEVLAEKEVLIRDVGNLKKEEDDDYVDYAIKLGTKVVNEAALGILICGTGTGMVIAANKIKGVRAGFCFCPKQARLAVEDNNINVLCLSADLVEIDENIEIVRSFINSQFTAEDRHIRRINKIKKYETTNY